MKELTRKKLKLARENYVLYLLLLPAAIYVICFNYLPIYGAQIAFRTYRIQDGIFGSTWVGLRWFRQLFNTTVNFLMLILVNWITRRISELSLF